MATFNIFQDDLSLASSLPSGGGITSHRVRTATRWYVPAMYPQPSTARACSMRVNGKAGSNDEERRWDHARELEPKAEQQPGIRHISDRVALQPTGHSSPEPCIPATFTRPAHKKLLVAPQAAKASPPSGAQALATHEQSNQAIASVIYASQVPLHHNDHPRSTKAGKPSASQATQPVIDYPKNPLLTVQAEVMTGENHGTWDKAPVGHLFGAEVTHPTVNLGTARALANHPWTVQTSTI
ncbi:hypothetical protein MRX96_059415 [Rhipicephalus microplus]